MKQIIRLLSLVLFASCGSAKTPDTTVVIPADTIVVVPKKDVGRGITATVKPTNAVFDLINTLRTTQPAGYGDLLIVDNKNKWLSRHVIAYARQAKLIPVNQPVDSVVYYFGSADAEVADSTGKTEKGRITDELVAFIYPAGSKVPVGDIVYSTNSVFASLRDSLSRIGPIASGFTVGKSRGINHYVDYPTSLMLAKYFKIPVYRGKIQDSGHLISIDSASKLEIAKVQVTVGVLQGDHFDLDRMVYRKHLRK